jgi:sensor histidine kinase YesM
MDASTAQPAKAGGHPKRRFKNYFLDPKFQLKFMMMVLGSTIVVASLFGGFLWSTTRQLLLETESAVEARSRAADTSRDLSSATLNNELLKRFDDPAFVEQLSRQSKAIDAQYELERTAIVAQRAALMYRQRILLFSLVGGLIGMVLLIALMMLIATHKIVGPLYRLKRITQEVISGKLVVPSSHLRDGDEFKHLFEEFTKMVTFLRAHQSEELLAVENLIDRAERTGVSPEVLRLMKALAEKMKARLDAR